MQGDGGCNNNVELVYIKEKCAEKTLEASKTKKYLESVLFIVETCIYYIYKIIQYCSTNSIKGSSKQNLH